MKMKTIYTEAFEKKLVEHFAQAFGCTEAEFYRKGTFVIASQKLINSHRLNLYQMAEKSFILVDPNHFKEMKQLSMQLFRQKAITAEDAVSYFGDTIEILALDEQFAYLDPAFFRIVSPSPDFVLRHLSNNDKKSYLQLKESCLEYEWEEAYIHFDQNVNFGIFKEEQLVGIAGFIEWDGIFSDIGIIVHPGFRQCGIAKILLSKLCEEGIEAERILQFRYSCDQIEVSKLIESIGFRTLMLKFSCRFTFNLE
jgi:ribosomal protein S18 acetylase RimI-like enzyme